jgi:hypothetical protein
MYKPVIFSRINRIHLTWSSLSGATAGPSLHPLSAPAQYVPSELKHKGPTDDDIKKRLKKLEQAIKRSHGLWRYLFGSSLTKLEDDSRQAAADFAAKVP